MVVSMTTWFISDTHFSHYNIIDFCNRPVPFNWKLMSREEVKEKHDDWLIDRWNERVDGLDDVYHLGDFAFAGSDALKRIFDRLNGNIHWIRGNHDYKAVKQIGHRAAWVKDYYHKSFEVWDPKREIFYKQPIIMCHYPIASWDGMSHGSWHLHGHCHGSLRDDGTRRLDMGVDPNNYYPVSLEEVAVRMQERQFKPVDHHGGGNSYELRVKGGV